MTLNPITAMSEQIQKLITEHGSATILRDHLALIKDQVVALEKKVQQLEFEKQGLMAENHRLEVQITDLKKEKDALNQNLSESEDYSLTDIHCRVLDLLFQKPSSVRRICGQLSLATEEVNYYVHELYNEGLVDPPAPYAHGEEEWRISQDGRKYIMGKGQMK